MSSSIERPADERPAAAGALDPGLAGQLQEGAPDGDQAAAVAGRQLALGGQPVARSPLAAVERCPQVEVDLMMERHGPGVEVERGHLTPGIESDAAVADNVISNLGQPAGRLSSPMAAGGTRWA